MPTFSDIHLLGRTAWSMNTDEDWNRNYSITFAVEVADPMYGPGWVIQCPGLPIPGSLWNWGFEDDPWAFCHPNWTVAQAHNPDGEPWQIWTVTIPFSTKGFGNKNGSHPDATNPLAEPPKVSGSFVKYTEEATKDRFGKSIRNSAHQRFRGPVVEFDKSKPTVHIEMNYPFCPMSVFTAIVDNVNSTPMWGVGARCVKLSQAQWTRNVYVGGFFYTAAYDFDIDFNTFDRKIADVGTMKLKQSGTATNPKDYTPCRDALTNELVELPLDGHGVPVTDIANQGIIPAEYYQQTDLTLLGIPLSF
jgi:hypothetical protein